MKKIYKFLLALLIMAVSMVSCTEQLEETVYSELLSTTAYETESDAEALIISVYAGLRGTDWGTYYEYDYLMVSESGTDTYGYDDWEEGTQKMEMGVFDNNYDFILNLWDGAYKVIGAANFAIEVLENMPIADGLKAAYIGEAKFLRGLAYYDLGFNFGDVILNIGEGTGDLPLSPQADVIAQVIQDFTDAAAVLGDATTPGRASKGAALGMRAKTHLNAKNWTEAANDAQAVMGLGDYALQPSVEEVFNVANNNNNEWIFTYMSSEANGSGPTSQLGWFSLSLGYHNGGWGRLTLAEDFYNSFALDDDRRTLLGNGYQHGGLQMDGDKFRYYALPGTPEYDALVPDTATTVNIIDLKAVTTTKYLGGHDRFTYRDLSWSGVSYPILRYADILLTRAEALNEGGQGGGLALVNEVRARSNATLLVGLDQTALRDAILEERAKEFFMEGHRRLDLIRSGKYVELWRAHLETKYPGENFGYINDSKIFFPIPQKEIDANDLVNAK
ncbi:MAG: RagB/SusD family nutrient uptake outer membrane protein [Bacteroidales bacterium]|nr:RagB/SusD family nutrient uptake outer membrane protein [Bacteroidales bacterium]